MAQPSAYQRVTSEYDVTEAGKADKWHLVFDGVDDFLETPSIDFTGTDEVSVFAGLKVNENKTQVIYELSEDTADNDGSFSLITSNGFIYRSKGTLQKSANLSITLEPIVSTFQADISAPFVKARQNGGVHEESLLSQGTGNFGNYRLYIGARGEPGQFSDIHIYSLIARGKLSTEAETDKTERLVADRTAGVAL